MASLCFLMDMDEETREHQLKEKWLIELLPPTTTSKCHINYWSLYSNPLCHVSTQSDTVSQLWHGSPLYNFSIQHSDPGWGPATTQQTRWETRTALWVYIITMSCRGGVECFVSQFEELLIDLEVNFYSTCPLGDSLNNRTHLWVTVTDNQRIWSISSSELCKPMSTDW